MLSHRLPNFAILSILSYVTFISFMSCEAGRIVETGTSTSNGSTSDSHTVRLLHGPNDHLCSSPVAVNKYHNDRPEIALHRYKRRVPVRAPGSKPLSAPDDTHTIRLFGIDFVYTNKDIKLWKTMLKKFPEVFAFGIVGIELEPRHNLHVRVGALSLNLYAVVEALTQAIVLAVVNRLADMATRGFLCLGFGEVVVGAGVRVLFAAGIRLQGLEDINEEVVQPLIGFVG